MNNRKITVVRPSQMFDSFMDEFFNGNNFGLNTVLSGTTDVDMYETDTHIIVKVKAPGYAEDDIKISVEDNILQLEGIMKKETEQKENRKYHIKEMREESFARSINLPTRVDAENSEAEFENGVLTIKLPKLEEAKPKTISIKTTKK